MSGHAVACECDGDGTRDNSSRGARMTTIAEITGAILAGGLGTRLRSVVSDRPKVLALVRGQPFLAYLLDQLGAAGIRRVVLLTGYKGEQIEQTFGSRNGNIQLEYSAEPEPLGTAGALRLALPKLFAGATV